MDEVGWYGGVLMDGREQKDVRASKSPSEMAYCGQARRSRAQLGDSEAESKEPRRASVVPIPIKSPVLHIYRANEKPLTKCD